MKAYLDTANIIFDRMISYLSKYAFFIDCPKPYTEMVHCILMTLGTIFDENPEPALSLFEECSVDGVTSYKMLPEFRKFIYHLLLLFTSFTFWTFYGSIS